MRRKCIFNRHRFSIRILGHGRMQYFSKTLSKLDLADDPLMLNQIIHIFTYVCSACGKVKINHVDRG